MTKITRYLPDDAYVSRSIAREALYERLSIMKNGNFLGAENKFLFAYIVKRNGTLEDNGAGEVYLDLRGKLDKAL